MSVEFCQILVVFGIIAGVVLIFIYPILCVAFDVDPHIKKHTVTTVYVKPTNKWRPLKFKTEEEALWWLKVHEATHRKTGWVWKETTTIEPITKNENVTMWEEF